MRTTTTILSLLFLAKITATDKIDLGPFPTVYMPESFDHVNLNGFSRALILSQRGQRYSSNLDCTMTLSVRGPFGVQLSFEHLDLARDTYDEDGPCEDYVQFYGGAGKETILSDPHCGNVPPPEGLVANMSSVTLRFRTNHYRERSGFRIKFDRVPLDLLTDCNERGVCNISREQGQDEHSGGMGDSAERKKRSVKESTNAGMSILNSWSLQRLLAVSLSVWATVQLGKVQICYGLQNR